MSSLTPSKPSLEAKTDFDETNESTSITISGIEFASTEELEDSLKESNKKTEIWTISTRLDSIERVTPVPKLTRSNWSQWRIAIKRLIFLTQSSAALLEEPPYNKTILMWSGWWAAKLKETAGDIRTAPSDNPRSILHEIVLISQSNVFSTVLSITTRFWNFHPGNLSLSSYIKEYQKRYHDLKEHCPITPDINHHMKYLFLFHVRNMQPELANRCRDMSYNDTISECLKWTSNTRVKGPSRRENQVKCNFCHNLGHVKNDCRKKKNSNKQNKHSTINEAQPGNRKHVLSVMESSENVSYQLDSGADYHVSGNENDFNSYSALSQTVRVAGGGSVATLGSGNILFPTSDGKIEHLHGAIHIAGETTRILSTAQLEKQGFSIRWPSYYKDVELIRPNGTVCATFRRESGRLIWRPNAKFNQSKIYSINRDWHTILGHPGQKAQFTTLKLAGIKGCKYPINCETCTKTKLTKIKGHGNLHTSSEFLDAIHMDLVSGQKSLFPTTIDKSTPAATWFLLAVDEYTSWKWSWPIYNKKTVPTTIQNFLESLRTQYNKAPKRIHSDSGTEFSNSELQDILHSRGIDWIKSSSHAPEQNEIAERNVRTVTEKMRALHLQSGLPLKLWPLILNAAINILNLTPNSHATQSPYFAVFNKIPNIKNLHPFGCRAFWLNPDQNKLKFQSQRGHLCRFSIHRGAYNP
ncbi:serine/threonine protein kinase domain protein [Blumeria hordei DH14]|uniref:Serine/threonine protein kinase domain protein n=1 Tax=Blumeria graminis f. sp. hordei (strain DH14) TaxID=546991 RepID=N1JF62_BLUG1|nr:serine/threonine protein kinase domain protein [Blumeria hordei DH14]